MEWFQAALHWNVTNVIPSSGTWHFAGSLKEHAEGCRVPAGGHPPTELVQNKPTFQRYTSVVTTGAVTVLRRRCLGFLVTFRCTEVPSSAGVVWVLWVPCCCSQLLSTACCQPQCTLQQGLGLVPHAAPCTHIPLCDAMGLSWAWALARTTSRTSRSRGWQHR